MCSTYYGSIKMNILAFLGSLGWQEMIIILVVILLLFGGRKLPELAKGVAKGLKTFKREMNDVKGHLNEAVEAAEREEEATPEEDKTPKDKEATA